ncbi:MAG: hypothetical protein M3072_15140, partial [Candidatus Dormibacteraeota bacterium]|nr:hypothetical protein [Candidatus Dormibacteraeota bacterium]
MIAVLAIVAGILVAAALDHRLGWGTLMSVALAVYCHRLYRQPCSGASSPEAAVSPPSPAAADDDDLRPGWAVRWGRQPNTALASVSGQKLARGGDKQRMG